MEIKFKLDEGAFEPIKAHVNDAGFDIRCRDTHEVPAHDGVSIDTGLHVAIPEGYVGFLKSKSGLNVKHDLVCEGVIDCGYTGSIIARVHNLGNVPYVFKSGDKITQLVIIPYAKDVEFTQVNDLDETARGDNGFGSSGK